MNTTVSAHLQEVGNSTDLQEGNDWEAFHIQAAVHSLEDYLHSLKVVASGSRNHAEASYIMLSLARYASMKAVDIGEVALDLENRKH